MLEVHPQSLALRLDFHGGSQPVPEGQGGGLLLGDTALDILEVSHWPCQNFLRTAGQVDTLPPSLPSSLLERGQTTALKKKWVFRVGRGVGWLL